MEKLSLSCTRQISSSTVGWRKNGLPNRKVLTKPIAVSAGTFDVVAERGRDSREYVKCASFSFVADSELNMFRLNRLIFEGPSVPFADVPYVATSNVWFWFFE